MRSATGCSVSSTRTPHPCSDFAKTGNLLRGVRVLVTGASASSADFVRLLEAEGAQVAWSPVIRIGPPPDERALQDAIDRAGVFDWLVFTSAAGVEAFARRRRAQLGPKPRIAVVGDATAAAVSEHLGKTADPLPERASASALADALLLRGQRGDYVLLVTARDASPVLEHTLRGGGLAVEKADAYTTVQAPPSDLAARVDDADVISLASPSAVRALVGGLGRDTHERLRGKLLACIGPATLMAAREAGLHVEVVPENASLRAMVRALCRYFEGHR
jgi:uroporphyrinogen-III synthase